MVESTSSGFFPSGLQNIFVNANLQIPTEYPDVVVKIHGQIYISDSFYICIYMRVCAYIIYIHISIEVDKHVYMCRNIYMQQKKTWIPPWRY